ncbi:MAG: hypothetical protein V4805_07515, partial [Pseudomonadota bacterium]
MKYPYYSIVIALSLLTTAGQASAVGRVTDVNVYDRDTGQQLRNYYYQGQNYVVGTPGNRYAISLRNTRPDRVMTVVSVDGVNVVSGQTAARSQTGYVLDPRGSTEINGWRKNLNEIAAFEFAEESDSYAARTGRPDNVGVIGVAVFREKIRPPVWRSDRDRVGGGADSRAADAPDHRHARRGRQCGAQRRRARRCGATGGRGGAGRGRRPT